MNVVRSVGVLLTLHLLLGCSNTEENAASTAASARAPLSAEDLVPGYQGLLTAYEALRGDLAADAFVAAKGAAAALADVAERSRNALPETQATQLRELTQAARELARLPEPDPDRVRAEFGVVSRSLVGLLRAAPTQQGGLHLFECPMVDGYGKWVQSSTQIGNPYMGKRMLRCGSERAF